MMKKVIAAALACAVVFAASGAGAFAATQAEKDAERLAKVKTKIHRVGTGEKARVSVKMKDGRKLKGYVGESREDDFVLRDTKTDAATTVAFADVAEVKKMPPPMSKAQDAIAYIGAGIGAVILVTLIVAATQGID
jgi:curli biogenesis system outer membrane secretion channel CsgG